MILVGRHRAFNDSLLRTSLTTWDVRVHQPRVEVVQQRTRCEDTKADPGDVGPEATRGSSVLSDRSNFGSICFGVVGPTRATRLSLPMIRLYSTPRASCRSRELQGQPGPQSLRP